MSAKTSKARRMAFFAALRATGNQTLAAERAKVSRSWVSLHRASDSAFRAAMEAAVTDAKARLAGSDAVRPNAGWRTQAGEELTVTRGKGGVGRPQIARARPRQWTPRIEARFLTALAASCNVKLACAAVELTHASAYNHRKRWPRFAERWAEALAVGYDRIEGALREGAHAILGETDHNEDAAIPAMTPDHALQLLRL